MDIFLGALETDLEQPTAANRSPAPGARDASIDAVVSFDVLDVGGNGVDATTIKVLLNGQLAYDAGGGGFQAGYSGSVAPVPDGYHVEVTRSAGYPLDFWVHVELLASDLAVPPNAADLTWVFRTRDPDVGADMRGVGVRVDTVSTVLLTGHFRGATVFGGGEPNETTLVSSGSADGFAASLVLTTGALQWARRAGGTAADSVDDASVF